MTQLHTVHHGMGIVRATNDVDIVLHIETRRGLPTAPATALEGLGYQLQPSIDPRNNTAHRFERLRGRDMVRIEGGTQALRRTINARLEIVPGTTTVISVPRPLGALILSRGVRG